MRRLSSLTHYNKTFPRSQTSVFFSGLSFQGRRFALNITLQVDTMTALFALTQPKSSGGGTAVL
jgi:hypothetical protein